MHNNNFLDSAESLFLHKKIIKNKKALQLVYRNFYQRITFQLANIPPGKIVELGSGAGFLKDTIPNLVTSDVIIGPGIDKVISATKIPFADKSITAFVMLNVFHHIKYPVKALKEMSRCLKKNGKIIMIEPSNSIWSKFVYRHFHHEDFNIKAGWEISGKGRLSNANMALPWIVFQRDRIIFEKKFPNLKIKLYRLHTPFSYLVSGGLSKSQFLPSCCLSILLKLEHISSFFNKHLGMFNTIVIIKS